MFLDSRSSGIWTPGGRTRRPEPAPRTVDVAIPASVPDDEVVELMEGITLERAAVRRIRRLLGALAAAVGLLAVQLGAPSIGWSALEPVRARTARPGGRDALGAFEAARVRIADLIRLGTVAAPATLAVKRFAIATERPPGAASLTSVRIAGVERRAGALDAYAATLRVLVPEAKVDVDAAAPGATGERDFGVTLRIPVPAAPPRAERADLAERLHVGASTLTVLGRLRELAHAGNVQLASTEALPGERATSGGLSERPLKLTATGAESDLLRYAELVAGCAMPVRVEAVELVEVDVARTPALRLELRVVSL